MIESKSASLTERISLRFQCDFIILSDFIGEEFGVFLSRKSAPCSGARALVRRLECRQRAEIYRVLISTNCSRSLHNRFASMHPASDVRYFVIMSRAMFIAILNGRRGGDVARISRDTRLLSYSFRNTSGKKHYCLLFFLLFRYAGEFFKEQSVAIKAN